MNKSTIENLRDTRSANPPARLATENLILKTLIDNIWLPKQLINLWLTDVEMNTYFDSTGMGRAEPFLDTFAICNGDNNTPDLGGKLLISFQSGYTQGTDPIDFKFNQLQTNNLGDKLTSLVLDNLPSILVNQTVQNGTGDQTVPAGATPYYVAQTTNIGGSSKPFSNIPPYGVCLTIMRIA